MPAVILTEAATHEVRDMLKANKMPDGYLEIKVNGDGCTGLAYGTGTEEAPGENDEVLEYFGLKALIDKKDAPVLNGTTIGFKQSLIGGGFQIDSPNAAASYGCGSPLGTAKATGNPESC